MVNRPWDSLLRILLSLYAREEQILVLDHFRFLQRTLPSLYLSTHRNRNYLFDRSPPKFTSIDQSVSCPRYYSRQLKTLTDPESWTKSEKYCNFLAKKIYHSTKRLFIVNWVHKDGNSGEMERFQSDLATKVLRVTESTSTECTYEVKRATRVCVCKQMFPNSEDAGAAKDGGEIFLIEIELLRWAQ